MSIHIYTYFGFPPPFPVLVANEGLWGSPTIFFPAGGCYWAGGQPNTYLPMHLRSIHHPSSTSYSKKKLTTILKLLALQSHELYPIGSMYGIFTYIYHKNQPNVGKYTIRGSCGYGTWTFWHRNLEITCLHFTISPTPPAMTWKPPSLRFHPTGSSGCSWHSSTKAPVKAGTSPGFQGR